VDLHYVFKETVQRYAGAVTGVATGYSIAMTLLPRVRSARRHIGNMAHPSPQLGASVRISTGLPIIRVWATSVII
jgi:hypothetical protein